MGERVAMMEGFLLGVISSLSIVAALFFLRFWKRSGDAFFLIFAASFFIEGLNRAAVLFTPKPNEGNAWIYVIRLVSFLLIIFAILRKNLEKDT